MDPSSSTPADGSGLSRSISLREPSSQFNQRNKHSRDSSFTSVPSSGRHSRESSSDSPRSMSPSLSGTTLSRSNTTTSLTRSASLKRQNSMQLGNTSRFRNIFGSLITERYYDGLQVALTNSPNLLRCNDKYFATPWSKSAGGVSGNLSIHSISEVGKINKTPYLIKATSEQLLDFDFYPFEKNIIATTGRDNVVKVWRFPKDGQLSYDIIQAEYYLAAHEKRVDILKFHPTAADLMLTASSDLTMRLWDFREMLEIQSLDGFEEPALSVAWSYCGDTILQACKDGKLNLFDPRAKNSPVKSTLCDYSAAKGLNVCFISDSLDFITTGFDKKGDRQISVWDGRKIDAPISSERAGNAPGLLTPFYDPTIGLLYLACKGEGIRLYEYSEGERAVKMLTEVKTERPLTALAMLPKFVCEVEKMEIGRFLKLSNESSVQTVSIRVPRKAGKFFAEDLYPPTPLFKPAITLDQWREGTTVAPVLVEMKPDGAVSIYEAPPEEGGLKRSNTKAKKKEVETPEGFLQIETRGFFYNTWDYRWVALLGSRLHIAMDREEAHSLQSLALADVIEISYLAAHEDPEQTTFCVAFRNNNIMKFKANTTEDRDRWAKALSDTTGQQVQLFMPGLVVPSASSLLSPPHAVATSISPQSPSRNAPVQKATVRGEVFKDGLLDSYSEGWFGSVRWNRRYVTLQTGVLHSYTNERAFLDASSIPAESMRLHTVISIRLTDINASYEESLTKQPSDLTVFQVATPRESAYFRASSAQEATEWINALMHIAGKAVREYNNKLKKPSAEDLEEEEEEPVENIFQPVIEEYVMRGSYKHWLAIINGDFYYYKSHLGLAPTQIIKSKDITAVNPITQPGVNGFELIVNGMSVKHFTRTDNLAQWWTRKISQLRDANFDLMESIGLKAVVASPTAKEDLEREIAQRTIDPLRVKSGDQPVLIQIHAKRSSAMQVKLAASSLTADSSFVLDNGANIYVWNGPVCTRVCAAHGADVANRIRVKDRGGNATVVYVNDTTGRVSEPFYRLLGIKSPKEELTSEKIGLASTAPAHGIKIFKVNPSRDSKKVLEVVWDEVGDALPSKDLLQPEFSYVIDGFSEIFVWAGSLSGLNERRYAHMLSGLLATQPGRPDPVFITRVLENTETIMFKEKFCDYPGMLPVNVAPLDVFNDNYVGLEQPEIDIAALHKPVVHPPDELDDCRGQVTEIWIIRKRRRAYGDNYEFDKEEISKDEYGQFYSGESYLLRFKYVQKNSDKYVVYFWQGRDSSVTEKGASALETINVSDETGGDATHVRVEQGKEPKHFLALFPTGLIIHLGKQAVSRNASDIRLYQIRELKNGQVRAVEAESYKHAFYSHHVVAVCTESVTYSWRGRYASLKEQMAVEKDNILRLPSVNGIVVVEEDDEPADFVKLFGKEAWADRETGRRPQKEPTKMFLCSGSSGVVVIEAIEPFCQDDLDNDHVFILDTITDVYVWIGGNSMKNEKIIALETVQKYIVNSPRGHKPHTNLWVTYPYEEPLGFTRHFHVWSTSKFPQDKRNRQSVLRPVDVILNQFRVKAYPLAVLLSDKVPEGIDRTKLEDYLSDEEFMEIFSMTREEFQVQPKWKQTQLKQKKKLF